MKLGLNASFNAPNASRETNLKIAFRIKTPLKDQLYIH